jgi:hypothetical protein
MPQGVDFNLLGASITDQVPDRHGCVAHLAQQ